LSQALRLCGPAESWGCWRLTYLMCLLKVTEAGEASGVQNSGLLNAIDGAIVFGSSRANKK